MQRITTLLYTIFLTIIWSLLPFVIITNLEPYYYWAFDRYNVYEDFAEEAAEVDDQFGTVITLTQPPFDGPLDQNFFSREDISHMQDVKLLSKGAYLLVIVSLAVLAFTQGLGLTLPAKVRRKLLGGGLNMAIKVQGFILVGLGILSLIALLFWRELFVLFHQILFPFNSYWLLDPSTSNLIKYFPPGIFQELSLIYILLLVILWEALRWTNRQSR